MWQLSELSSSVVPSPNEKGGFPEKASDLPGVKRNSAQRTNDSASDRTETIDDDTARKRNKRHLKPKTPRIGCWNATSLNNNDQERAGDKKTQDRYLRRNRNQEKGERQFKVRKIRSDIQRKRQTQESNI